MQSSNLRKGVPSARSGVITRRAQALAKEDHFNSEEPPRTDTLMQTSAPHYDIAEDPEVVEWDPSEAKELLAVPGPGAAEKGPTCFTTPATTAPSPASCSLSRRRQECREESNSPDSDAVDGKELFREDEEEDLEGLHGLHDDEEADAYFQSEDWALRWRARRGLYGSFLALRHPAATVEELIIFEAEEKDYGIFWNVYALFPGKPTVGSARLSSDRKKVARRIFDQRAGESGRVQLAELPEVLASVGVAPTAEELREASTGIIARNGNSCSGEAFIGILTRLLQAQSRVESSGPHVDPLGFLLLAIEK